MSAPSVSTPEPQAMRREEADRGEVAAARESARANDGASATEIAKAKSRKPQVGSLGGKGARAAPSSSSSSAASRPTSRKGSQDHVADEDVDALAGEGAETFGLYLGRAKLVELIIMLARGYKPAARRPWHAFLPLDGWAFPDRCNPSDRCALAASHAAFAYAVELGVPLQSALCERYERSGEARADETPTSHLTASDVATVRVLDEPFAPHDPLAPNGPFAPDGPFRPKARDASSVDPVVVTRYVFAGANRKMPTRNVLAAYALGQDPAPETPAAQLHSGFAIPERSEDAPHVLMITELELIATQQATLRQLNPRLEIMTVEEMQRNKLAHCLQPSFRLLPPNEAERALMPIALEGETSWRQVARRLPRMRAVDPIARILGARKGDVMRVASTLWYQNDPSPLVGYRYVF